MPDVVLFDHKARKLRVNWPEVRALYGNSSNSFECKFVAFGGTLRPHITQLQYAGAWTEFKSESPAIDADQVQVSCYLAGAGENGTNVFVYRLDTHIFNFTH